MDNRLSQNQAFQPSQEPWALAVLAGGQGCSHPAPRQSSGGTSGGRANPPFATLVFSWPWAHSLMDKSSRKRRPILLPWGMSPKLSALNPALETGLRSWGLHHPLLITSSFCSLLSVLCPRASASCSLGHPAALSAGPSFSLSVLIWKRFQVPQVHGH